MNAAPIDTPQDSEYRGLVQYVPARWRPYLLLARLDRPIGWWLLLWPCWWGVAQSGELLRRWWLLPLFLIGAIAMRGAGCVYNDIVDRDLDAQVERTRSRPLPSGSVTLRAAWIWLVTLCLVGLAVLLALPRLAQMIALASLALVAAYPFMKRITWWPQAWLGMVFSWGALVGWAAAAERLPVAGWWLYAGAIFWVIGYDTIYALQDIEDDATVGIRSSARRMGGKVRTGVAICYLIAVGLWAASLWQLRPDALVLAALVPAAVHLAWQVTTLVPDSADNALARFRANRLTGMLVFFACFVVGATA